LNVSNLTNSLPFCQSTTTGNLDHFGCRETILGFRADLYLRILCRSVCEPGVICRQRRVLAVHVTKRLETSILRRRQQAAAMAIWLYVWDKTEHRFCLPTHMAVHPRAEADPGDMHASPVQHQWSMYDMPCGAVLTLLLLLSRWFLLAPSDTGAYELKTLQCS
jgi:hypothetical protein